MKVKRHARVYWTPQGGPGQFTDFEAHDYKITEEALVLTKNGSSVSMPVPVAVLPWQTLRYVEWFEVAE